jgi:hypothetical protein
MKQYLLLYVRPRRGAEYLVYSTFVLIASTAFPLSRTGGLLVQVAVACVVLATTTGRLLDAGVSRFWAFVMLPTLAAPWLCPLLFPTARPSSALAQFFESIFLVRSGTLGVLALALLAVPIAIGLLPTRRPSPTAATGPQATPAAQ